MSTRTVVLSIVLSAFTQLTTFAQNKADVIVYGDSSGAVVAAISAQREGRSVIWLNPTGFPGGMSASGLGATDFLGKQGTFGGIASEFYAGIAEAYGKDFVRSFEPHVGKQVFEKLIKDAGVTVVYNEMLDRTPGKGVTMEGQRIKSITMLSGKTYEGKMFIDASYVGDLMAAAGVTFTVGREPESQYGESIAGVRRGDTSPRVHYGQKDKDHFTAQVDPYLKRGEPASGLLPHINKIEGLTNGQGDKKIQAYNYRVCLTTDPANRIPIEKPAGYREIDHELLLRNFEAGDTRLPALIEPLEGPGQKVDWNNMHAVGSDYVGANWEYPEASYERRREIEKAHETYLRGFLWTMGNSPRVPENIRKKTAAFGLPKDEFTDNGGWPWMIYIREARRMVTDYVMTQLDCDGVRKAPDPVGLGSFGMDSHCVQHIVTDGGKVQNEGVIWRVPPRPYGISYRAIIPKKGECENLFSPICLSASHVAHGSIRMEPVFMALSQSAAIAAGLAIDQNLSVQDVPYAGLREKLEAAKQIVRPEAWKPSRQPKKPAPKATTSQNSQGQTTAKPNILLIFADDIGYEALNCYGGLDFETPNLNRMADGGLRFNRAYTSPVCTPSRVSLHTGLYSNRHAHYDVLPVHQGTKQRVDFKKMPTFAQQLRTSGYRTSVTGKWQLATLQHHPDHIRDAGFDSWCVWQIWRDGAKTERHWNPTFNQDGKIRDDLADRFGPDALVDYVIDQMRSAKAAHQPFLIVHNELLPHWPVVETPDDRKLKREASLPNFIHYMDKLVGRLLDEVDTLGLRDNTYVVFMGDNGTWEADFLNPKVGQPGEQPHTRHTTAGQVNGGKAALKDGGCHVPLLIWGPPAVPTGEACDDLVDVVDLFPTFCELSGTKIPVTLALDGRSLVPQIHGGPGIHRPWTHSALSKRLGGETLFDGNFRFFRNSGKLLDARALPLEKPADANDPEAALAKTTLQAVFGKIQPAGPRPPIPFDHLAK